MNLTAITIRKEKNRIANVTIKKDIIQVNTLITEEPVYEYILSGYTTPILGLIVKVIEQTSKKTDVIFSVPGSLTKICCAENTISKMKLANIEQTKKAEIDRLSNLLMIAEPSQYNIQTFSAYKSGKYITALGISKIYVNTILEACIEAGIDISKVSIEPEALTALRFINNLETACCLLEVEEDSAVITIYDPAKGMLSLPLPEASWNSLNSGNGAENLSTALAIYEITADNTFGYKDADASPPIYLLSEYDAKLYGLLNAGQHASRFENFIVPQFFQSKGFNSTDVIKYASTLGLAQRPLFWTETVDKHRKEVIGK